MRYLALVLFLVAGISRVAAAEWRVGRGGDYATIREALAAAAAGDVLEILPGRYTEGNLKIDKTLTLRGVNFPILSGDLEHEVLTVTAPDVVIRGLEIRDTGTGSLEDLAGIKVKEASGARIEGNRLRGCGFGIYLARAKNCSLIGNDVFNIPKDEQHTGNGIHMWSCANIEVLGNTVRGQRDGIYLEFTTDSRLEDNRVEGNFRYGLHFMFSHGNEYHRNSFQRNGAGVAVMYSRKVEMTNNHFGSNWGGAAYGLLLKEMTDGLVARNVFDSNTTAITMDGSNRMRVEGNEFRSNGRAIHLNTNSSANTFSVNNFVGNSFDIVTHGQLGDNKFEENYWDRYDGYDLKRDGVGDVPHRPVSLYGTIVNRVPPAILLLRSPAVHLLDQAEKVFPTITPETVRDEKPAMRPHSFARFDPERHGQGHANQTLAPARPMQP